MKYPRRPSTSDRTTRRGWVPVGLSGPVLLVTALVPLCGLVRVSGDELAEISARASTELDAFVDKCDALAERVLDPETLYQAFVGEPMREPPSPASR